MPCRFAALPLLVALALPVHSAIDVPPPPAGSEMQLFIENDMLAHTDRYYTNGIKFSVGLPFDLLQMPAAQVLRSLDPEGGADIHVGLFVGQNMYTPRDIGIAGPQPDDRLWAAWLYLGGVAQRADLVAHGGGSLGTVLTLGRVGGMLRLGHRLSGFGPDTIEPGGAMLHGTRAQGGPEPAGLAWYVFAGVDHRLVGHNIFLDGPVFRDGPSVERRSHVRDLSIGFSLRVDRLRFSWTRIHRSEEFRTAAGGGGAQRFDSLNLGFEF